MSGNQSQPAPQRGFLASEVNNDLLNIPTITIHQSFSSKWYAVQDSSKYDHGRVLRTQQFSSIEEGEYSSK